MGDRARWAVADSLFTVALLFPRLQFSCCRQPCRGGPEQQWGQQCQQPSPGAYFRPSQPSSKHLVSFGVARCRHWLLLQGFKFCPFFDGVQCTLPSPQQGFLSLLTTWDVYTLVPSLVLSFTDFFTLGLRLLSLHFCSLF